MRFVWYLSVMARTPRNTRLSPEQAANIPAQRLHKLLALSGIGSRRDMEAMIAAGRVSVNGKVAEPGFAVIPTDIVRLDGKILHLNFEPELPQVLLYHKPEGEIVSQDDPEKRASVFDKLPRVRNGKWVAVGRLDINTSGLLIFTTSGELANRLMHPRYEVEREYAVRILGELTEGQMLQLTQGIELEDGVANFHSIYPQGGEGVNHWYNVTLSEGRNREVRRLFEALGLVVSRLMRVRFGPVALPPRLTRGKMLKLEAKEVVKLLEWAELSVPRNAIRQKTPYQKAREGQVFTPKTKRGAPARDARTPRTELEARQSFAENQRPARATRSPYGDEQAAPTRARRNRGQQGDFAQAGDEQASRRRRATTQAGREPDNRNTPNNQQKRSTSTTQGAARSTQDGFKKPSRKPAQKRRETGNTMTPQRQQTRSDRNRRRG